MPRILYCSYHCYPDPTSGAAISMQDLLVTLTRRGWQCEVLCGPRRDTPLGSGESGSADRYAGRPAGRYFDTPAGSFQLTKRRHQGVSVTTFRPMAASYPPAQPQISQLAELLRRRLERRPPDLVLTYGGYRIGRSIIATAKRHNIPVVFWLCNLDYRQADLFAAVEGVVVHSRFVGEYYRQALGICSTVIAPPLDRLRFECAPVDGRYVTFINPRPQKGVSLFVRIAMELARHHPGIPLLVVEGRADAAWLRAAGIDLARLPNVRLMQNSADPREFYGVSRVVLVPSLWEEPFGMVAAEAIINEIPALATRRGGLPEVLAEAGFLFDVPPLYASRQDLIPLPEEVAPWIDTIARLWYDRPFYRSQQARCRKAARAWHAPTIAEHYERFLHGVIRPVRGSSPS